MLFPVVELLVCHIRILTMITTLRTEASVPARGGKGWLRALKSQAHF